MPTDHDFKLAQFPRYDAQPFANVRIFDPKEFVRQLFANGAMQPFGIGAAREPILRVIAKIDPRCTSICATASSYSARLRGSPEKSCASARSISRGWVSCPSIRFK